ncbi:hypothetical protein Ait01nite_096390 [Actinoplanes italicus]|uniref:Sulfotransferase domain-containing protein n=1 Tax=Actinoplanes italicus TaxID=113567 RepID=A0A2T0JM04_9ACTN|nr:sulfotransferase domain-containing protein [Actinoplanes italicus]PRX08623.1 hypothetical protein CLV67_13910 [Actinoplanes italicus]GIE36594.1 hypothetical protein Ait01nite_096390 [Actinoplanes italicus]
MTQAPQAMVISCMKAGTHLIQELVLELDYRVVGAPRPTPRAAPRFTDEQRRAIAALVLSKADYDEVLESPPAEFAERTDDAWAALVWHWHQRLGQPVVNRYGQTRIDFTAGLASNPFLPYSRFSDTPAGLCWILHELDLEKVDGSFMSEWVETSSPPLVFNFRDPRDVVVSMINFLQGATGGYGNFFEADIFSTILKSKPTWEEKIDYALTDPLFVGGRAFERALWLLNHPKVLNVRYEDLIGEQGGESRRRQVETVNRVLTHLGSGRDPEKVAAKVYNPESWSFHRGRTGAWRERFTARNIAHFKERYGSLLELYGYE